MSDLALLPVPAHLTGQREAFIAAFGAIYEHSPWVAAAVWPQAENGGLGSVQALAAAMAQAVADAPREVQLVLLRAHPELAGRAAVAGTLTAASAHEQRGAGLDQCSPQELAEIQRLNRSYLEKFGFPFIIAVTGLTRDGIIATMAQRLAREPEAERAEALRQVDRIAWIRLMGLARSWQERAE